MQLVVVIYCRRFGSTYRSHRKRSRIQKDLDPLPLKVGPISCPKTSVRNYHYWLRNNSEERSSHATFMFKAEGLGPSWYRGDCDGTMRAFVGRSQGTGAVAGNEGVCWHCVSFDVTFEPWSLEVACWSVFLVSMHKTVRCHRSVDHNVNSHWTESLRIL